MDDKPTLTPIICTLGSTAQRAEIARYKNELAPHVQTRQHLSNGTRLTFDAVPGLQAEIDRFVALDKSCCAFLDHKVEQIDKTIQLTVTSEGDGIKQAQAFMQSASPIAKKFYHGTFFKAGALATACGVACAAPLGIAAFGVAGLGLGALGLEFAVLGLMLLAGAGYWVIKQRRIAAAKGVENENRCGC